MNESAAPPSNETRLAQQTGIRSASTRAMPTLFITQARRTVEGGVSLVAPSVLRTFPPETLLKFGLRGVLNNIYA